MSWKGNKNHDGYQPKVYNCSKKFDELCMTMPQESDRKLARGRRDHAIDMVSLHCTAGGPENPAPNFYQGIIKMPTWCGGFNKSKGTWSGPGASANFIIGGFGDVAIPVEVQNKSWTTSSSYVDCRAATFEIASEPDNPVKMTDYALSAVIETLAWLMKSGQLKGPLKWQGEQEMTTQEGKTVISGPYYAQAKYSITSNAKPVNTGGSGGKINEAGISKQNVVIHRWFSTGGKICPAWYLTERLGYLLDKANELAGQPNQNNKRFDKQSPHINYHNTFEYIPLNLDFNNQIMDGDGTFDTYVDTTNYSSDDSYGNETSVFAIKKDIINAGSNRVSGLDNATTRERKTGTSINLNEKRKSQFESLRQSLITNAPNMDRDIVATQEMYDSNILKGDQTSKGKITSNK